MADTGVSSARRSYEATGSGTGGSSSRSIVAACTSPEPCRCMTSLPVSSSTRSPSRTSRKLNDLPGQDRKNQARRRRFRGLGQQHFDACRGSPAQSSGRHTTSELSPVKSIITDFDRGMIWLSHIKFVTSGKRSLIPAVILIYTLVGVVIGVKLIRMIIHAVIVSIVIRIHADTTVIVGCSAHYGSP